MFKRVVSGVILACIIVPTFFWGWDMVRPVFNMPAFVNRLAEAVHRFSAWVRENRATHYQMQSIDEEARLVEDLEFVQELLQDMDRTNPDIAADMRALASELLDSRKALVDQRSAQIAELTRECLSDLDYLTTAEKRRSTQTLWDLALRRMAYQRQVADHSHRKQALAATPVGDDTSHSDKIEEQRRHNTILLTKELD